MSKFDFSLVLSNVDPDDDLLEDRLYQAGCDDALVNVIRGNVVLDFTREAKNFTHAVVSACLDVQKTGATIAHLEPDNSATMSDIAERIGISRQAVSHFVLGQRGPGNFPAPRARITSDSPIWNWVDVARWCVQHEKLHDPSVVVRANVTHQINLIFTEGVVALKTKRAWSNTLNAAISDRANRERQANG